MLVIDERSGRMTSVGENEALILLIGLFVGRSLVTTVSYNAVMRSMGFISIHGGTRGLAVYKVREERPIDDEIDLMW